MKEIELKNWLWLDLDLTNYVACYSYSLEFIGFTDGNYILLNK